MLNRILMILAVITFFIAVGCGDAKEPASTSPEPAVATPTAEEAVPEVSEEDIGKMKAEAAQAAATEITDDNLAESAAALEKEIDGDIE